MRLRTAKWRKARLAVPLRKAMDVKWILGWDSVRKHIVWTAKWRRARLVVPLGKAKEVKWETTRVGGVW